MISNEEPVSVNDINNTITGGSLFDFSKSVVHEADLEDYIEEFLNNPQSDRQNMISELPGDRYLYTPLENLFDVTYISIHDVCFKNLSDIDIAGTIPDSDSNKKTYNSLIDIYADGQDYSKYVLDANARIRYVALIESCIQTKDKGNRDKLIARGLKDPNQKIKLASMMLIRPSSSDIICDSLCDLMEDDELFAAAQTLGALFNNEKVYKKYYELASSDDSELSSIAAQQIVHAGRDVAIPTQVSVLKNWEDYKDTYTELGYTFDTVLEQIVNNASSYARLSKTAKYSLIDLCTSSSVVLQSKAFQCLDKKWAKSDFKQLETIDTTDNPLAQALQIKNMARLNAKRSLAHARQLIQDPNQYVRDAAVKVLGKIGEKGDLLNLQQYAMNQKQRDRFDYTLPLEAIHLLKN